MIAEYLYQKLINVNQAISSIIKRISEIPQGFIKRFTYYLIDDLYLGKAPKERRKNDPAFLFYNALPRYEKQWIRIQKLTNESEQHSVYAISSILKSIAENPFSNIQEQIKKIWQEFFKNDDNKQIKAVKHGMINQLFNSLNLSDLTDFCRNSNISGYSNLRKAELIDLILNSFDNNSINAFFNQKNSGLFQITNQFPIDISSFFSETITIKDDITLDDLIQYLPTYFKDQQELVLDCINSFNDSKNQAYSLISVLFSDKEQANLKNKPLIEILNKIDIKQIKDDQNNYLIELNSHLNEFKDQLADVLYPAYLFLKKHYDQTQLVIIDDSILKDIEKVLNEFDKLFDLTFKEKEPMNSKIKKLTFIRDLLIKLLRTSPILFKNLIISSYIKENTLVDIQKGFKAIDTLNSIFGGMGWDLSSGILKNLAIQKILEYSSILEKLPELQKIAENLGRFEGAFSTKEKWKLSPFVSEEIFDIHLSDDIHRVLAVELGKLNHPLLKSLFMANLLDHKLLTYQLRGNEKYSVKEKKEEKRGPIIICIDTSGSMAGFSEQLAKSLSLAVIKIAQMEKRNVHIILFSGPKNIKEYSLEQSIFREDKDFPTDDYDAFWKTQEVKSQLKKAYYSNVIDVLSFSFGGGTDFREPLKQAKEKLQEKKYEKADILFISDGISFIDDIIREISEEIKERKARIFTVVIGKETNIVREFSDYLYVLPPSLAYQKSNLDKNIGNLLKKIHIQT